MYIIYICKQEEKPNIFGSREEGMKCISAKQALLSVILLIYICQNFLCLLSNLIVYCTHTRLDVGRLPRVFCTLNSSKS